MTYSIPLFKLNYGKQEEKAVLETLRRKWISTGPRTIALEKKFSEMLGGGVYAVAVANCTAALHLALKICGIKEHDEVIVPSLTFVATANAVRYVGAVPVFCDVVGDHDLTMDPNHIQRLVTGKTKAVIVMHYGGFACDMDAIMKIAVRYKLKVIEDACHGPLSEYNGRILGTIGDIGCFSFFSNKNISTAEGGILVTPHQQYAERAKLLRSHGMTTLSYERSKGHSTSYDVVDIGYNYRFDDIRASLALVQLAKLRTDMKKRARIRELYCQLLSNIPHLTIPFINYRAQISNYIFPIVLKDSTFKKRNALREYLQTKGIQTSVHYPAVHRFSMYKNAKARLPRTEYVCDNEITLPMFATLKKTDVRYICWMIREFISS